MLRCQCNKRSIFYCQHLCRGRILFQSGCRGSSFKILIKPIKKHVLVFSSKTEVRTHFLVVKNKSK